MTRLVIDREAAARLGVSISAVATALNNGFSQRQVSIIYRARNQYRVVLELEPGLQQYPEQVDDIYVPGAGGTQVPLSSVVQLSRTHGAAGGHPPGPVPGGDAHLQPGAGHVARPGGGGGGAGGAAMIGLPDGMRTEFAGNASAFQSFARDQPLLILAALLTIYIVLGVLYEHLLHPITILSTLPTAGHRRAAGADRHRHALHRHRADRGDPADGHREEERHHAGRLRAGA